MDLINDWYYLLNEILPDYGKFSQII